MGLPGSDGARRLGIGGFALRSRFRITDILKISLIAIILISVSTAGILVIAGSNSSIKENLVERNRALGESVAHEVFVLLDGYNGALELLAFLPHRGGTEVEAAARAGQYFDSVIFADESGRVRAASSRSGLVDFDVSRRGFFTEPWKSRKAYLSNSTITAEDYEPSVAISVPAKDGVVIGFINLRALAKYVSGLSKRPDDILAVADAAGFFVAHSDLEKVSRRENLSSFIGIGSPTRVEGVTTRIDGKDYLMSRVPVPETGWSVIVAQPLARFILPAQKASLVVVFVAAFSVLAASLAVSALLHFAERDIAVLVDQTQAIAEGDYTHPLDYQGYRDFNALADNFRVMAESVGRRELGLQEAETRALKDLREKEVLLREVHHRVKNNLQLVISLLSLEADPEDLRSLRLGYEESINRVRSMAMIHEKLYQSENLAWIDFSEYVRSLAESLLYSGRANMSPSLLDLDLDPVELDIDLAIPCGLLINEALTNSLKYGLCGPNPRIIISMKRISEGLVRLELGDTGPGIPFSVDPASSRTLGLKLIRSLAEQLKGRLSLERSGGTKWSLVFPAAALVTAGERPDHTRLNEAPSKP